MDQYLFGDKKASRLHKMVDCEFAGYLATHLNSLYWMYKMLGKGRRSRPVVKHLPQLLLQVPFPSAVNDCKGLEPPPNILTPRNRTHVNAEVGQAHRNPLRLSWKIGVARLLGHMS